MNKMILGIVFLIGCAPILNEAKIDGLASYTLVNDKVVAAEKIMKANKIEKLPEWILIDMKLQRAVKALKTSLLQKNDANITAAIKEMNKMVDFTNMDRLQIIYRLNEMVEQVNVKTAMLNKVNASTPESVLLGKQALASIVMLSKSTTEDDDIGLNKALQPTYIAIGKFDHVYYSIVRTHRETEPCFLFTCPNDSVCKVMKKQYVNKVVGKPDVIEEEVYAHCE